MGNMLAIIADNDSDDSQIEWSEGMSYVVDILGEEIAWEMVAFCGGARLDIPKTQTKGNYVFMQLSEPTRSKLIKEFGGDRFYIPKFDQKHNVIIAKAVEILSQDGCSQQEIGSKLGLSETRIGQIRKENKRI